MTEFDGSTRSMVGFNNGDTGKAPPLPRTKFNVGVNWMRGAHSARVLTKYTDDVTFGLLAPVTMLAIPGGLETRLYAPYGRVFTLSLDVEI